MTTIPENNASGAGVISRRSFVAGAASVATSVSLGSSAVAKSVSPRVLRFSDHEPLGGMRTHFFKDVLFPAIEKEAKGRLRIEDHWNGEIAQAYDALGAVRTGEHADMATVVPEYTAKELPLHQIFKSFPTGPSGGRQIDFFKRVYAEVPAYSAEFAKNSIVPLFFGTGYPVAFFSTDRMANLAALSGGKWRSASFWHLDFLRNAGATPITMHWGPEIYDALKARSLDGLMVNVDSGYMLKVHEAAPHVLVSQRLWLGHLYVLAINQRTWRGLDEADRSAIMRAGESAYRTLGSVMTKSFEKQLEDLRNAGAHVRVLEPDEVKRFENWTRYRQIQETWADLRESEGVTGAKATLDETASIMDNFIARG